MGIEFVAMIVGIIIAINILGFCGFIKDIIELCKKVVNHVKSGKEK